MTNNKATMLFLAAARRMADGSDHIFVGQIEPFIAALQQEGMSQAKIPEAYGALKRSGYIKPHGLSDIDVFTITPAALKWFLIEQHGAATYRKMADEIDKAIVERLKNGDGQLDAVAERLKLPLVVVQEVLYAEKT